MMSMPLLNRAMIIKLIIKCLKNRTQKFYIMQSLRYSQKFINKTQSKKIFLRFNKAQKLKFNQKFSNKINSLKFNQKFKSLNFNQKFKSLKFNQKFKSLKFNL